ncbi:MAG: Membrane protein insertion efficiency factor YidD, partial [uncultured Gemmatimonadetes bacterium]
ARARDDVSHPLLSEGDIAAEAPRLPLSSHVLALRAGGAAAVRRGARLVAAAEAAAALQPPVQGWLRPRSL